MVWETITWSSLIVLTIIAISFFPWYMAQTILNVILVLLGLAAIFWYIRSRGLYMESQTKSAEIMEKQRAIASRQKTIDLIYDNSADGIVMLDNGQRIISFSPGMEAMTGYKKEEVLGRPAQQILKFRADSDSSLLPDVMFLPKDVRKNSYVKNTITTKEGREIDIEASYSLISENKNEHQGLAIIRDVTYENELMKRDKEFIAITSHQMNTPLSIIRGYVSLLKNGKAGKISGEQAKYLEEIYGSTKKLIDITSNLLSISRIEQDKIKIEKTDINVADLFSELKQSISVQGAPEGVTIEFKESDPKMVVYADHEKLVQALNNLINNSIKYTKQGKITIAADKEDSAVRFSVSDTGMGIPEEDIEHIGQKFFRSQNAITLDNKGTGLGMFIVKTIVEKHNGSMKIMSQVNKGTTVTLIIPGA